MSTFIASLGDHRTHIDLTLVQDGNRLELVSTMHCKGMQLELARELVISEDDAIDVSTDLEWAAVDEMAALDIDYTKSSGWPEALIKHFAKVNTAAAA
ncbi:hypothetical protein IGS68_35155 (plasmid) [Skermanella sp. TT6]|uniref:DUF2442 domain-containing protein n=1 Tax=Skermanella cutis TaxID=2775420 RepID=A0ABX7BKI5_9PROT|nr:hypothetical protein [Skermanella sp. TT6]QQP94051.1 hypothetical protein IGS68_35155 [Skermanella sp. TT6]